MTAQAVAVGDLGGRVVLPIRRRSSRAEENDRRLRAALIEIIGESGWDSVSAAKVAARIGLTATAVRSRAESIAELGNDLWEHIVGPCFVAAVDGLIEAIRTGERERIATALGSWASPSPELAVAVPLVIAAMFDDELAEVVGVEATRTIQRYVDADDPALAAADVSMISVALSLLLGYREPERDLVELYAAFPSRLYSGLDVDGASSSAGQPIVLPKLEPEPVWTRVPDSEDPYDIAMLLATIDVLSQQGYAKATVARITRRARLSAGAIRTRYPDKAHLVAHAASSVLLTPVEMESMFRRLVAEQPLAIAQAVWVRELLRPVHRGAWRVWLDLALRARHDPVLAEFGPETETGPYFGLMLIACLTEGADILPFVLPFQAAFPV